MLIKNYSDQTLNRLKNIQKKIFILSKVKKEDFDKINKKTNILFKDPSTYLKTPTELDFDFVIGKRTKVHKDILNRKPHKNLTSNFAKIIKKRMTKIKDSNSGSLDIQKVFDFNRRNRNINNSNNEESGTSREQKVKELANIFNNHKNIINKNKKLNTEYNIEFSKAIPDFLAKLVKKNLKQQENALKYRNEYNHIFKKVEEKLTRTMSRDNKINKKNSENKYFHTSYLIKNSITDYRNKIEDLKLKEKNKKKKLLGNNNIRFWEMSLRRTNNFNGLRKGYLNINTDERPFWIMETEKNKVEEEKIINPNNDLDKNSLLKEKCIKGSTRSFNSRKRKILINLKRFNDLQIKGKKLIDFEEQQANRYNGNIKILDFKYDNDSTKDLLFKMNFTLNKFSLGEKLSQ